MDINQAKATLRPHLKPDTLIVVRLTHDDFAERVREEWSVHIHRHQDVAITAYAPTLNEAVSRVLSKLVPVSVDERRAA